MRPLATLHLSTGESFRGELIGAASPASGELVFTTAMVGYSESLTDPSYYGQILVFAYPLIGNYGVPAAPGSLTFPLPLGFESPKIHARAVIVASDSQTAYHWSSCMGLDAWLKEAGVPGLVGLDTRHLVQLVRNCNPAERPLRGAVLLDASLSVPSLASRQLNVQEELTPAKYFDPGAQPIIQEVSVKERTLVGKGRTRIGLVDCGVKWNILRELTRLGCEVELLPADTDLQRVDCQGWLLSNGPGNPKLTNGLIDRVRLLLAQQRPILGICLGHQILSLAAGADTEPMGFGHRSHNQPVYLVGSRQAYITSQNHGYVVKAESLPEDWEVWFRNVNDHSVEGIQHKIKPFRSVQFHPESAGGPRDTGWIMQQFVGEVQGHAKLRSY